MISSNLLKFSLGTFSRIELISSKFSTSSTCFKREPRSSLCEFSFSLICFDVATFDAFSKYKGDVFGSVYLVNRPFILMGFLIISLSFEKVDSISEECYKSMFLDYYGTDILLLWTIPVLY